LRSEYDYDIFNCVVNLDMMFLMVKWI